MRPLRALLLGACVFCTPLVSEARCQSTDATDSPAQRPRDDDIWHYGSWAGPEYVEPKEVPPPITPRHWLIVPASKDADGWRILARFLLDDDHGVPRARSSAERIDPEHGVFEALETERVSDVACAYTFVHSDAAEVLIAHLEGAEFLFVNGEMFAGDPLASGRSGVPVPLRAGDNHLFVVGIAHAFTLRLDAPRSKVGIATWDVRWPADLTHADFLGFTVFNASLEPCDYLHVHYGHACIEGGDARPGLTDWKDGGGIDPLGLCSASTWLFGIGDPEQLTGIVVPICVCDGKYSDADRQLLRPPASAQSARDARSLDHTPLGLFPETPWLVYGTHGSIAENSALLARARADQQIFWSRTGAIPDLLTDEVCLSVVNHHRKPWTDAKGWMRDAWPNMILYGNAQTNAAIGRILPIQSPIQVEPGVVHVHGREMRGDDIAGWFLPQFEGGKGPTVVMVFASTGTQGTRLGNWISTRATTADDHEFWRPDAAGFGGVSTIALDER